MREKGFSQTIGEGEPPYRWTFAGLKLDLMPADPGILGFSNRWYEAVLKNAFVAETFARLLADEGFRNALPGLIEEGSPAVRTPVVLERLRAIAG